MNRAPGPVTLRRASVLQKEQQDLTRALLILAHLAMDKGDGRDAGQEQSGPGARHLPPVP